jgi:hypothetical protein
VICMCRKIRGLLSNADIHLLIHPPSVVSVSRRPYSA